MNNLNIKQKALPFVALIAAVIALPVLVSGIRNSARFLTFAVGENSSLRMPSTATVAVNANVTVPINLTTDNVAVRGVDVVIQYDPAKIALFSITPTAKNNGIFKTFSPVDTSGNFNASQVITNANTSGRLVFSALAYDHSQRIINSPFNGNTRLASLVFRGLQPGSATVSFVVSPSTTTDSNIVVDGTPPTDKLNAGSQVTNLTINVTNPTTPTPPPSGTTFEAENAQLASTRVESEYPGFTGTGYANFLTVTGASVTWNNVSVSGGGSYNLTFRYSLGSGARAVELRVNGSVVRSSLSFTSTGTWNTYRELSVPVQLVSGANIVKLTTIGFEGPNIDSLRTSTQTPTTTPAPTPPPSGTTFEAENAQLAGTRIESEYPGFTGTGYANFLTVTGASVTWNNVSVSGGGSYNLTFRYSLGSGARAVELRVNGSVVRSSLSFTSTGTWNTYRELSVPVQLVSGANIVKLTTIGSEGPNIDSLRTSL